MRFETGLRALALKGIADASSGRFEVRDNDALENLAGFDYLTSVGGSLGVSDNKILTGVHGFVRLHTVRGDFSLVRNMVLTSVYGFNVLSEVGGSIDFRDNSLPCPANTIPTASIKPGCACERGYFGGSDLHTGNVTTMWLRCEACVGGRTTKGIHSASKADCYCGAGTFYAPGWDVCIACQEHLHCPGESKVPFVHAGYHAEFLPNKERAVEFEIWRCKVPAACPADDRLEPKLRRIGPCPNRLGGNGCSSCPDDYILVDNYEETGIAGCAPCAGDWRTRATLPAIFVVGLLLLCVAHRMTDGIECKQCFQNNSVGRNLLRRVNVISKLFRKSKKTIKEGVALLMGYLLGFSLICELNAEFAPAVATVLFNVEWLMFDSGVLSAECVVGKSVAARYCAPLAVPFLLTISSVAGNKVMRHFQEAKDSLDGSRLHDRLGLLFTLLYVLLAKWAAQYLEVASHPNASDTVVAFPEVDCQSQEHLSMLPGFVFAMVFYVVSIPVYMGFLCFRAPKRFCSESFAWSVKFLVSKWTPCSWWFSLVLLLRNLFAAMVSVIFVDGNQQLFSMGAVYLLYLYAVASVKPWAVSWFSIWYLPPRAPGIRFVNIFRKVFAKTLFRFVS